MISVSPSFFLKKTAAAAAHRRPTYIKYVLLSHKRLGRCCAAPQTPVPPRCQYSICAEVNDMAGDSCCEASASHRRRCGGGGGRGYAASTCFPLAAKNNISV